MHKPWKGMLVGLATAALVGSSAATGGAATCGNLDNSGSAAINDVILSLLAQTQTPGELAALCGGLDYNNCADINANGAVDIGDTVQLLRDISQLPSCLPAPCVSPGATIACTASQTPGSTLPNSITTNTVIPDCAPGTAVFVDGVTFIQPGVVLTVRPGAEIRGVAGTSPASVLIAKRGAKLNALGTLASPIVWTSSNAPGTRQKEDWGGVMLLGNAPVNVPPDGTTTPEGLEPSPDLVCGGPNVNDNSGCVRFNRIEFSGRDLTPNNELNLFVTCGVGRGTLIDFVQAHNGADDCFEWFGGTVNSKHLVASACGDDGLDTQLGTTGAVQFALIAQHGPSVESGGSNGWEMDGRAGGNDDQPISNPKFCNVTALGVDATGGAPAATNQVGIFSREGNSVTVANSIITGFSTGTDGGGLQLRNPTTTGHMCHATCAGGGENGKICRQAADCPGGTCTFQNAVQVDNATLQANKSSVSTFPNPNPVGSVRNSLFFNNGDTNTRHGVNHSSCDTAGECACTSTEYFSFIDASLNVDGAAADPMSLGGGTFPPTNLVPAPGSLADTHPTANCTAVDGSFESTDYLGAFDPNGGAGADWTAAWTAYPLN